MYVLYMYMYMYIRICTIHVHVVYTEIEMQCSNHKEVHVETVETKIGYEIVMVNEDTVHILSECNHTCKTKSFCTCR